MVGCMVQWSKEECGRLLNRSALGEFWLAEVAFRELLTEDTTTSALQVDCRIFSDPKALSSTLTYEAHTFRFADVCRASVRFTGGTL
jgi:hypothetical protein